MKIAAILRDWKNLICTITFIKFANISKVVLSYVISRVRKKPRMFGVPVSITIEPTTACNLRCPECPSGLRSFIRSTGNIDWTLFKKIIDDQYQTLSYLILYF